MKTIVLLGSTGSVGTQTLSCCARLNIHPQVLCAYQNTELLEQQARAFMPRLVVIGEDTSYQDLKTRLADTSVQVRAGREAVLEAAAAPCDVVCNAIVGFAGLECTLSALSQGRTVALANKESLVAAGALVIKTAADHHARLIPVDSEHSAVFQSLQGSRRQDLRKIFLTASGGPFRGKTARQLQNVTVKEALSHPNWSMGAKITIDSATLVNKGLEFIEAMWIFDLNPNQIEIVIHPQSVLHSAVEFQDGAVIGQMGTPDMAVPIQYALTYPNRFPTQCKPLSLFDYGTLEFSKPDLDTFTGLSACMKAARQGGLYPCAVNGANEAAVHLFLEGRIPFPKIGELLQTVPEQLSLQNKDALSLEHIREIDREARQWVYRSV